MSDKFDADAYTRELRQSWNSAAAHYQGLSADFFAPITAAFIDFSGLKPGQHVLDVACGPGSATLAAKKAVGRGGKVVGIDLAGEMLKLAGKNLGTVDLREMDAEALDFPDGTFDSAICQLGLMLFARPEAALAEMIRVVKRAGRVSCLVQGAPEKMMFTSLISGAVKRHAPEVKAPWAPNLYAFGGEGVLEWAMKIGGLQDARSRRLSGKFEFDSPAAFWERMATGGGRTSYLLKSLSTATQEAIKRDVLTAAQSYERKGRLQIPYEFVMASGVKP
jgi:ubiquinone/menaquinone biosynthesis C-methylase UbiE